MCIVSIFKALRIFTNNIYKCKHFYEMQSSCLMHKTEVDFSLELINIFINMFIKQSSIP